MPESDDPSAKHRNAPPIRLGKNVRRGKSSAGVLRRRIVDRETDDRGRPAATEEDTEGEQ
jgi:antirestriction protein ArdC